MLKIVCIGLALALSLTGCSTLRGRHFDNLRPGMTRDQVIKKIGKPEMVYSNRMVRSQLVLVESYACKTSEGINTGCWVRYIDGKLEDADIMGE